MFRARATTEESSSPPTRGIFLEHNSSRSILTAAYEDSDEDNKSDSEIPNNDNTLPPSHPSSQTINTDTDEISVSSSRTSFTNMASGVPPRPKRPTVQFQVRRAYKNMSTRT